MKAVFLDCTEELRQVMTTRHLEVPPGVQIHHGDPDDEEIIGLSRTADVLLVEHTVVPEGALRANPKLRGIVFMGTGAESYVPMTLARELGIPVLTTPGYGNVAVAEHAMALTFAAARRVANMDQRVRSGLWRPMGGVQLSGRKVAVVGLGGVGRTYADLAAALGMQVAGWNRAPVDVPYYKDDLDEALTDAAFVSLHLALKDETRNVIDTRRLQLLAPGAILVNTARAGLVDEEALREELDAGHLAHAALDVLWTEPPAANDPWLTREDVTFTAHAAYMTADAYVELWRRTLLALNRLAER
jgi:D-3-phosphoglycerate dehydrogenase